MPERWKGVPLEDICCFQNWKKKLGVRAEGNASSSVVLVQICVGKVVLNIKG